MVNFKKLADRAKTVVEQQGGSDALKEKAERMKAATAGKGSIGDKAKAAAAAAKEKPAPTNAASQGAPTNAASQSEPVKQGTTGEDPPAAQ
jgi:hypothetical protein